MFRIDSDAVIDATMAGGPARYINHSCSVSFDIREIKVSEHGFRRFQLVTLLSAR